MANARVRLTPMGRFITGLSRQWLGAVPTATCSGRVSKLPVAVNRGANTPAVRVPAPNALRQGSRVCRCGQIRAREAARSSTRSLGNFRPWGLRIVGEAAGGPDVPRVVTEDTLQLLGGQSAPQSSLRVLLGSLDE